MSFATYPEIFEARGHSYDRAMHLHPQARAREFEMILSLAALSPGQRAVDAPAGGGYLPAFASIPIDWLAVETTSVFGGACARTGVQVVRTASLAQLPIADGCIDCVISLAGIHHMSDEDKARFFGEAHRVLRPGGRFALVDVHEASPVARFLNGFVDAHNPMGHEGEFLGPQTLDALGEAGFVIEEARRRRYPWVFPTTQAMGEFCKLLFGLEADVATVVEGIGDLLGYDRRAGKILMHWELFGIRGLR